MKPLQLGDILAQFKSPSRAAWEEALKKAEPPSLTSEIRGVGAVQILPPRDIRSRLLRSLGGKKEMLTERVYSAQRTCVPFFSEGLKSGEAWEKNKKSVIEFDCTTVARANGTGSQELALAVSGGIEWLRLCHRDPSLFGAPLYFRFLLSPDFVFEVAKCRAFLLLWDFALKALELSPEKVAVTTVAEVEKWAEVVDSPLALARMTVSGAAALSAPYDCLILKKPRLGPGIDELSCERLAENVGRILQEEARVGVVEDPMAGSFHAEEMTSLLAESAWALVREIEKTGGVLKSRLINDGVQESSKYFKEALASGKEIVVELNKYQGSGGGDEK